MKTRRILVVERLTNEIITHSARLTAAADLCTAIDAPDSGVAMRMLQDSRWRTGSAPLYDEARARQWDWTHDIVRDDLVRRHLPSAGVQSTFACGLSARFRLAALGLALVDRCAELTADDEAIELDLVATDPYLRNCFETSHQFKRRPRAVRLHRPPEFPPGRQAARELLAAQFWLRKNPWRRLYGNRVPAGPRLSGQRTALVFAMVYGSIYQMESIFEELTGRGWRIVVIHYGDLPDRRLFSASRFVGETVPFTEASRRSRVDTTAERPRWELPDRVLDAAPVSRRWLRRALDSSWNTAVVQIARHRRVLERWRPHAAFLMGVDVPAQALQAAAAVLSIPTVFIPHGFAFPTPYELTASRSVVYGDGCVKVNSASLGEAELRRLIATGHAPYDLLMADYAKGGAGNATGPTPPPHRPYLVLGLATWGWDLLCHVHQDRFLRMLGEALPDDAFLVCKLHPGGDERLMCETVLGEKLPRDAFQVVSEDQFTTRQLLGACRVAVSNERSMVLVDAIVRGCPAIAIHQAEYPFGSLDRNHPGKNFERACRVVGSVPQLKAALVELTRSEPARQQLLAERSGYMRQFLVGDGRAAERIADVVDELVVETRSLER